MKSEYKGWSPAQPPPLQLRRPRSGEINKNGDESVVLIHPVGDLTLALVIRLGFTVRMEAISAVLLPQEEADILPGADILPPAVFTPNTFYRITGEIMIKGAGDYIGGFLGPAGSEARRALTYLLHGLGCRGGREFAAEMQ